MCRQVKNILLGPRPHQTDAVEVAATPPRVHRSCPDGIHRFESLGHATAIANLSPRPTDLPQLPVRPVLTHQRRFQATGARCDIDSVVCRSPRHRRSCGEASHTVSVYDGDRTGPAERPPVAQPQTLDLPTTEDRAGAWLLFDGHDLADHWHDLRGAFDERGLLFDASLTIDVSQNFRGGVSTSRTIARHLFDLNLTIDTERLCRWPGGTLFFDFQTFAGETGDQIVGDYQIFSNIDTLPVTQVPQMWLEQRLWNDTLRIKVGMVDANSEFAYVDHGALFLNSSMGFSPTIFVLPTYPDPATSINVFWYPNESLYIGAGVYDGAGQRGVPTGSRGPRSLLGTKLFSIGEVGVHWESSLGLPGRTAAGAWYHNGDFDTFTGSQQTGTAGWYWLMDQLLFRERPHEDDDEQGIGLFVQVGQADRDVSEVWQHLGAGLAWRGIAPTRDDDTLGIGVTRVWFSDLAGLGFSSETSTELFYNLALTRFAELTFDLQYIRHPGGRANVRDAIVGTTRFLISF